MRVYPVVYLVFVQFCLVEYSSSERQSVVVVLFALHFHRHISLEELQNHQPKLEAKNKQTEILEMTDPNQHYVTDIGNKYNIIFLTNFPINYAELVVELNNNQHLNFKKRSYRKIYKTNSVKLFN